MKKIALCFVLYAALFATSFSASSIPLRVGLSAFLFLPQAAPFFLSISSHPTVGHSNLADSRLFANAFDSYQFGRDQYESNEFDFPRGAILDLLKTGDRYKEEYLNMRVNQERIHMGERPFRLMHPADPRFQLALHAELAPVTIDVVTHGAINEESNTLSITLSNPSMDSDVSIARFAEKLKTLVAYQDHIKAFGDAAVVRLLTCNGSSKTMNGEPCMAQQLADLLEHRVIAYNGFLFFRDREGSDVNPVRIVKYHYTTSADGRRRKEVDPNFVPILTIFYPNPLGSDYNQLGLAAPLILF